MDPIDNILRICKNRFFLWIMAILYFYVTQRSVLASRIVMGLFLVLSVVYGFLFRMIFRKLHKDKLDKYSINNVYQLVLPVPDIRRAISEIVRGGYEIVLVRRGSEKQEVIDFVLRRLEKEGIRTYLALDSMGYEVRSGIATNVEGYMAIPAFVRNNRARLFGVDFCIARTEEAVHHVMEHLSGLKGKYICFSNVHTTVMARESKEYANVLNSAAMVFPDGAPIAEIERRQGNLDAERVAGPDFMQHMFSDTVDGSISHYFYGSTQETLSALSENLKEKYPGIDIRGMYSPPFREITPEEDEEDIRRINESGADIVWVGLGAPKQEKWMYAHRGRLNAVMMGVGAGFDFHAGTIRRAPLWLQRVGLEWLYRLFTDPKRLFRRYIVTNVKFIVYLVIDKIMAGEKN
jgi:exopolysaccharide biosynthesis WecB/TagA/CpsF family protein